MQSNFVEYFMRGNKFENLVKTGKFDEKKELEGQEIYIWMACLPGTRMTSSVDPMMMMNMNLTRMYDDLKVIFRVTVFFFFFQNSQREHVREN